MDGTQTILRTVDRAAARVRMWRIIEALVRAAKWSLPPALALFIVDKFVHLHLALLSLPLVAFAALAIIFAARALRGVNRFAIAKIIDDRMGLKDRLTSALHFDRLRAKGEFPKAAIAEAAEVASRLDMAKLSLGSWPRHTAPLAALAVVTLVVAVGPLNLASWLTRSASDATDDRSKRAGAVGNTASAGGSASDKALEKMAPGKPLAELTKLESEPRAVRDPRTMDTTMTAELLKDIEGIKASLDLKDMKDLQDAFKDDKAVPRDTKETKPPPIAPLDQELLDDIARAERTKSKESPEGKDQAIGVAVKMPARPGAKLQGQPKKGPGGQGGGDVGESGDTRSAPRRVPVRDRDRLVIESRRSSDVVRKTDLEKSVMSEVMMRLSMKDVEMTAKASDVPANFAPQPREPVLEEIVPLGLRGYVQRYFEGLAPRRSAEEAPPAE